MDSALLGALSFAAVIGGLALFLNLAGRLSFWKLASKLPEEAIRFMESHPAWVLTYNSERPPGYSGPYFLSVPSIGRTVRIYGDPDRMEESEARDRKSTRLNSSHSCASRMPSY